ncbi:MAG: NAD(P)H-dependent oxidoreductase subunit E [Acutalibacteraceae bacterium]
MKSKTDIDYSVVDLIVGKYENPAESLISLLQDIQEEYDYLPTDVMVRISEKADIPLSRLMGVATFYSQFKLNAPGKYKVLVCMGTACHVNNGERVAEAVSKALGVAEGETTQDGLFSWEEVACLGCCSLSPVMMINGQVYGKLDGKKVEKIINDIRKSEQAVQ